MSAATRLIRLPSNKMLLRVLLAAAVLVIYTGLYTAPLTAQTLVSGDIAGTITDPSGAVVPNATVSMKSNDTGQTQTTTSNSSGAYRFSLVQPGNYTLTYTAPNFQTATRQVRVAVGQATMANVQLSLSSATQTVNVTSEAPVVETENGNVSTTFTQNQIALVPNPGNDLSYVAQTAPGAAMNTESGYGNFSTFGLPATSNLFTFNGMNENDPFLNLNNSGASNLLLGNNDVREATVVNNGYTGQYGGLAGANVNYVSKSGSNNWHGNAIYWWNGRTLNANEYFNKGAEIGAGLPNARPFVNDNQWAASIGGPIVKDKTFFFVDTEGLRVVLPTSQPVLIPSPQFEAGALAAVGGAGTTTGAFYQKLFNLYNNAPGAKNAVPAAGGGCPAGFTAVSTCALQFQSTVPAFNPEWLLTARVDQNIGSNDRAFVHFRMDRGTQATYTDPINSAFSALSNQPQYEGQFNETHTFGPNTVNQFILAGAWYSAIFGPANIPNALAQTPFEVSFADAAFYPIGNELNTPFGFPQGRNATQYQIIDDFSHTAGNHNLKFGINFKRNDITDFDPGIGTIGNAVTSAAGMFSGTTTTYSQAFPARLSQPLAVYGLGFYGQDEWRVSPSIKLTFAMRMEHNSNPVCVTDCFANFGTPFDTLNHNPNTPYNQAIIPGQGQMITNTRWPAFDYEPRFGFAISPFGSSHSTVLRGGFGIFADFFPGVIADSMIGNSPTKNTFVIPGLPLTPGLPAAASSANSSFLSGFASGGTFASISASNPGFVAPNFTTLGPILRDPNYQEWNLELEQGLGSRTALTINYVGNHGYHELVQNAGLNAYCDPTLCGGPTGLGHLFSGLPTAPADPRFGTVFEAQSVGVSNYNGVTTSLTMKFSSLQIQANYTYSHALDDISNGGVLPFTLASNISIENPIDPFNLRQFNYGNSDYDVRHYVSLNYVFNSPDRYGPHGVLGGWVIAGTLFAHSGYPYSVYDGAATAALGANNYGFLGGPSILAGVVGPTSLSCGGIISANPAVPCLNPANFTAPGAVTGFANQSRNQFRGPGFFDTDLNVMKNFHIPGWEGGTLGIGATAFNILNHPNFDQPVADIANAAQFGDIVRTVNPPTTPYGAFLGSAASFRIIQLNARLTF
jgi:hypothetical protein